MANARHLANRVAVIGLCAPLLASCATTDTPDGDYLAFVRDVMVEAGKVSQQTDKRSEQVLRAVSTWGGGSATSAPDAGGDGGESDTL